MSFSASFKFDGGKDDGYDVINCNYSFHQATDEKGRPASKVNGGSLFVQVSASDDDAILNWMVDPFKKVNGSLTFKKIDEDSTLKEITFEEGYCVQFSESFSGPGSTSMTISLTISAKKITVGAAIPHENIW